jgi:hypothetical protein
MLIHHHARQVRVPSAFAVALVALLAAVCGLAAQAPSPVSQIAAKRSAEHASGFHIVVSLADRHMWVIDTNGDTLRSSSVAIGVGTRLRFREQAWKFDTPRGTRTVIGKDADPVWVPPEWFYVQVAEENDLKLARLSAGPGMVLSDGRRLEIQRGIVGVSGDGVAFDSLPVDEHIVFDGTLFMPPIGTHNRRVDGALGKYRLDLGDGYLMHGTPDKKSIGTAATHGCIRLGDDDIEWLYDNVPLGTRVYIY